MLQIIPLYLHTISYQSIGGCNPLCIMFLCLSLIMQKCHENNVYKKIVVGSCAVLEFNSFSDTCGSLDLVLNDALKTKPLVCSETCWLLHWWFWALGLNVNLVSACLSHWLCTLRATPSTFLCWDNLNVDSECKNPTSVDLSHCTVRVSHSQNQAHLKYVSR